MKFKKKPVVIEAVQWNGENQAKIILFCSDAYFEPLFELLRFWFCENILRHAFISSAWVHNGRHHRAYKVCKRHISEPLKDK